MRILALVTVIFALTATAHAQYISPSADFFLHDRSYETFLRDHFRFNEPKALRIEYWNVSWMDSEELSEEYVDHLHIEGLIPIYMGTDLVVDIPIRYSHVPIWSERGDIVFGASMNFLEPQLMTRWTITDRLKAIAGWEYNLKGDGEYFGKSVGRKICLLKGYFSYDLISQLNFTAGARLDRYYYDTDKQPEAFKLADRLYYQPAAMLNWHPNNSFIFLLGMPFSGAHVEFGEMIKAEARIDIDMKSEIALSLRPVERIIATLRFFNTPYEEIPVESLENGGSMVEMLGYTDNTVLFEVGWKLNPAALAAVGFRYGLENDVEISDRANESVIYELDGKPHYAIGATFTMGIEALLGMR